MLLAEYLPEHDIYLVIPVLDRKPDPNTEYVFTNEFEQALLIQAYYKNPVAAIFAYQTLAAQEYYNQYMSGGLYDG